MKRFPYDVEITDKKLTAAEEIQPEGNGSDSISPDDIRPDEIRQGVMPSAADRNAVQNEGEPDTAEKERGEDMSGHRGGPVSDEWETDALLEEILHGSPKKRGGGELSAEALLAKRPKDSFLPAGRRPLEESSVDVDAMRPEDGLEVVSRTRQPAATRPSSPCAAGKRERSNAHRQKMVRRRRIMGVCVLAVSLVLLGLILFGVGKAVMYVVQPKEAEPKPDPNAVSKGELDLLAAFSDSDSVFYTSGPPSDGMESFLAGAEQMLHTFTLGDDGTDCVDLFSDSAPYFSFLADQYAWYADRNYIEQVKVALRDCGIATNGYIWPSKDSSRFQATGHYLYDSNLKFISAVSTICFWEGNCDFLNEVDQTGVNTLDASKGKTVREKLDLAVSYCLTNQYREQEGLFYDTYEENDGTSVGAGSNLWYNFRFGYLDAYNNIYFNKAASDLSKLYLILGDQAKAEQFSDIVVKNREAFQRFWDPEKGRYIGAVDSGGTKHDYGFVFLNLEAIAYGLADKDKADVIFTWLDGEREIEGEDSTGADIYAFGFAPRSTTVAANDTWWDYLGGKVPLAGAGAYGEYYQNGGAAFSTSYFDLLARLRIKGPEDAAARMQAILAEYRKDKLIRDPKNASGIAWKFAIVGEYPESGLVPVSVVHGFFGLQADGNYLTFSPNLPAGTTSAGIRKIYFSGNTYHFLVEGSDIFLTADAKAPVRLRVGGFAPLEEVTLTYVENDKIVTSTQKAADHNGILLMEDAFGKDSYYKLTRKPAVPADGADIGENRQKE